MAEPLEYFTPEPDPVPGDLKAVAWVFVAFGFLAVVDLIAKVAQGSCSLNFSILEIFVGFGLLKLSPGWRTCGLVFLWLTMVICGILAVMLLFSGILGRKPLMGLLGMGLVVGFMVLSVWQYRVLTRPNVRRLFGLS